jgi:transposase
MDPRNERVAHAIYGASRNPAAFQIIGVVAVLAPTSGRVRISCPSPIAALITVPGIDRLTAWTILAELGPDMSVFEDAEHAASWCAICPGNRESGGKRLSGRTRKGNRYIKRALC